MNMKNAEGYPDPTAAIAVARVAKTEKPLKGYLPLVYVASPFAGDMENNTQRARRYCRFVMSQGCIPFAPHLLYPQFLDDTDREERELGLFFGTAWICKCNELWVFGGRVSDGMAREITIAKRRGLPVRYFDAKCEEVSCNE